MKRNFNFPLSDEIPPPRSVPLFTPPPSPLLLYNSTLQTVDLCSQRSDWLYHITLSFSRTTKFIYKIKFESSHKQNIIMNIFTVNFLERRKMGAKRQGMAHLETKLRPFKTETFLSAQFNENFKNKKVCDKISTNLIKIVGNRFWELLFTYKIRQHY